MHSLSTAPPTCRSCSTTIRAAWASRWAKSISPGSANRRTSSPSRKVPATWPRSICWPASFPHIALSCGWDDQALEFFAWGARSWVCAGSNFLPREHVALYEACVDRKEFRQGPRHHDGDAAADGFPRRRQVRAVDQVWLRTDRARRPETCARRCAHSIPRKSEPSRLSSPP